ncbi:MAG: NlpC/P60 family protein [Bacilli bacterium]
MNNENNEIIPEENEPHINLDDQENDLPYQAQSTNKKNIKKDKNIETNKKVSKMATQAAATYFGGEVGGKIVNKINKTKAGDKINEVIGKRMNDIAQRNKITRMGQEVLNDLDDKGVIDAGQTVMDGLSGNKQGATNSINKSAEQNNNTKNGQNIQKNKQKMNFSMKPKHSTINTSDEEKKKIRRNKVIQFIIKNPWVLLVLLIIFLLLVILLIILGGGGAAGEEELSGLSYLNGCSEFPMKSTTLSKDEFVSLVQQNLTSSIAGASVMRNNAGKVYDIATKNNVNPELVVVRADMEGYSGGKYNYWGIGAYNGQSGFDYNTFDEGVLAFVNLVSKYSTVREMMSTYAYIGKYWYNAGNWGLGGCQYIDYIKDYYTDSSRYDEVKKICDKNNCPWKNENGKIVVVDSSKCTLTNEMDQDAYAGWQAQTMVDRRNTIFGLSGVDCSMVDIDGELIDIENIDDIIELGTLISKKAIATFDNYQYSQSNRAAKGYVDCSSLVARAYELFNINYFANGWYGTTSTEMDWCKANNAVVRSINVNDFIPGDLIFNNSGGHVVMYVGNGQVFEAAGHDDDNPANDVRVTNYYGGTIMVCRPLAVYFREKGK